MKSLIPALFLLLPLGLFAGTEKKSNGPDFTVVTDSSACPEVLVVVYDVTGNEDYSKVQIVSLDDERLTAVDPYNRLADGVYLIVASSNQSVYRQKLVIDHSALVCGKQ